MVRSLILLVLFIGIQFTSLAGKVFEGVVHYEVEVVFPDGMPESQQNFMKAMMTKVTGKSKTIYFGEGMYKFIHEFDEMEEVLFNAKEGSVLKLEKAGDQWVYRSKGTNWKKSPNYTESKEVNGTEDILGYKCKKKVFTEPNGSLEVHFNADFALKASDFEKYHMEQFHHIAKETNAVPLRLIMNMKDGSKVVFTAKSVKEGKVDEKEFLPKEGIEVRDISKM